ncbi:protein SAWADEE HOMEODOMAIN HOMOLOG 2 [Oryza brachyantha]|nr:protein SAWADEE HOMEODOMAIN HOMOLOG 2 [Oryza brachyantha]XP_040381264.1 protein SAWADEE HOMEODOMAIN HOMOLOG 2 [Oryza brachyantha]
MGRPPSTGGPAFRFTQAEVAEMEARLQQLNNAIPHRSVIQALADKFTASPGRAGKVPVQPKQVWNWFQNRRYSHRSRTSRGPPLMQTKMLPTGSDEHKSAAFRAMPSASAHSGSPSGKGSLESGQVEFEAKSARDGAWYDVAAFLSHRLFESGDPEVRVRFSGFGAEEDEWINVRKCVRQRSLPCESTECVAVLPGDLILCFQEGKEQALYFDAHVLDAQRRRHDVRGCRCRFLVRYDHDQSEEIVPLRKVCRRPETDYRLQILHAARAAGVAKEVVVDLVSHNDKSAAEQKPSKQHKMMDVNTDEVAMVSNPDQEEPTGKPAATMPAAPIKTPNDSASASDVQMDEAQEPRKVETSDEAEENKMKEG